MKYKEDINNDNRKLFLWILLPIILLAVLVLSGCSKIISWSLLLPITVFISKKSPITQKAGLQLLDYSFLIIAASEILALLRSSYMPNSVDSFLSFAAAIVLWFYMRSYITEKKQIVYIVYLLLLASVVLTSLTILNYVKHRNHFLRLGFVDLTAVRQYYHPLGQLSNDWTAMLICLLPAPFVVLFRSNKNVLKVLCAATLVAINYAVLVSFSRGAYLALFLFYISLLFSIVLFHRKSFIKCACIATISLAISFSFTMPDRVSVLTTLSMNKTTVQSRSTEGRLNRWQESLTLFKSKPCTGYGGGNFQMASTLYGNKNYDTLSFRSTNSYLQILVEKGAIGGVCYLLAIIAVMVTAIASAKKSLDTIPFIAAFIALLAHELFFSSISEKIYLLFVMVILLYLTYYPLIHHEKE